MRLPWNTLGAVFAEPSNSIAGTELLAEVIITSTTEVSSTVLRRI